MNSNYLYLMHESFPPFHMDFSPSFLHSKKPKVQPLTLWENILRGCLASKKKKIVERKRKQKRSLYFTKYQMYISSSLGKSSPRVFFQCLQESLYRKVIYPSLDTSQLRNYMSGWIQGENGNLDTKISEEKESAQISQFRTLHGDLRKFRKLISQLRIHFRTLRSTFASCKINFECWASSRLHSCHPL